MAGDWFARVRAENDLIAADYERRRVEDCVAGRHHWVPTVTGNSCRTCRYRSDDPNLTDCPYQGTAVAS